MFPLSLQTSEKEHLLREQTELEQNLEEIRYSLCELCKSVSVEPGCDQDQQVSQPTSSGGLVDRYQESQLSGVTLASTAREPGKPPSGSAESGGSESEPHTEESVSEPSCPDSMSLLKDCLDMDGIL